MFLVPKMWELLRNWNETIALCGIGSYKYGENNLVKLFLNLIKGESLANSAVDTRCAFAFFC